MTFLALEISVNYYILHVHDGVRTAQLGVVRAWPPRAAARARDRKLGKLNFIAALCKFDFQKSRSIYKKIRMGTHIIYWILQG